MKEDKNLQGLCKECTHRNSCEDAKRHLNMVRCSGYRHWRKQMRSYIECADTNLTDKEKDFLLDCLYKTDWTYRAVADTIIKKLHLIP